MAQSPFKHSKQVTAQGECSEGGVALVANKQTFHAHLAQIFSFVKSIVKLLLKIFSIRVN
jgi:hypothetical protein